MAIMQLIVISYFNRLTALINRVIDINLFRPLDLVIAIGM